MCMWNNRLIHLIRNNYRYVIVCGIIDLIGNNKMFVSVYGIIDLIENK